MMKSVHSIWAYIMLALLLITVINALVSLKEKKHFEKKDFKLGLFTLISTHIQLVIGLGWYFMSPWYKLLKSDALGVMKNSIPRLLAVEHPLMMLFAVTLITIGWSKHKKQVKSKSKFKTFAVFYGLALVFVLARIPWSNWLN